MTPQAFLAFYRWHRFDEAMPEGPFYVWYKGANDSTQTRTLQPREAESLKSIGYTHWYPAPPLPEPPIEETQGERDVEAWRNWFHVGNNLRGQQTDVAWRAALAWERREVAKIVDDWESDKLDDFLVNAIRARVGGAR